MHQFICKSQGGRIVPLDTNKERLLNKILRSNEELDLKFKVTIEVIVKNINEQQISLYNAFILKASNHFGNTFQEMEQILKRFYPYNPQGERKGIMKWSSEDLDNFISKASSLLAEQGFLF